MKRGRVVLATTLAVGVLFVALQVAAAPVGTAFTYQGKLNDGGAAASGAYDLQFTLYDAVSGGAQVGSTLTKEEVAVTEGVFTVSLDFGSAAFTGSARWLEIGVRPGASTGSFTALSSRNEPASMLNATSLPERVRTYADRLRDPTILPVLPKMFPR